jgi:hypothetical protein
VIGAQNPTQRDDHKDIDREPESAFAVSSPELEIAPGQQRRHQTEQDKRDQEKNLKSPEPAAFRATCIVGLRMVEPAPGAVNRKMNRLAFETGRLDAHRNIRQIREDSFPRRPAIETDRGNLTGVNRLEALDVQPRFGEEH